MESAMILSGKSIRERGIVEPFSERTVFAGMSYGIGPAGYDVRLQQPLDIAPGGFMLGSLIEHLNLPNDVVAIVHDKSTLARMGIALQNTVVEPGWNGYLTVEITNHGPERVRLPAGSPIAQLLFHLTDQPCEPYTGKYQGQPAEPVPAMLLEPIRVRVIL